MDVARNKDIEQLLLEYGAEKGTPLFYAVYLKTRGTHPQKLASLIADLPNSSLEEGLATVEQLPKKEGKTIEWDEDNNLSIYKEILLQTYPSKAAAQTIVKTLSTLKVLAQIV